MSPVDVVKLFRRAEASAVGVFPPLSDYRPLLERWLGPQSWSVAGP